MTCVVYVTTAKRCGEPAVVVLPALGEQPAPAICAKHWRALQQQGHVQAQAVLA